MSDTQERFAFGAEQIDGYLCVAEAAGESVEGMVLEVARRYDDACRERIGEEHGTVDRETANEIWTDCIRTLRLESEDKRAKGYKSCATELESIAAAGEEVAEAVF